MITGPADVARIGAYLIVVGILLVTCTKGMRFGDWVMFTLEILMGGVIILFWNYQ